MTNDRKPEDDDELAEEIILEVVLKHVTDRDERQLALHWLATAAAALNYLSRSESRRPDRARGGRGPQ